MPKRSQKHDGFDVVHGLEPEEAVRREAERVWQDLLFRVLGWVRVWLTAKLAWIVIAAIAGAPIAFIALPIRRGRVLRRCRARRGCVRCVRAPIDVP